MKTRTASPDSAFSQERYMSSRELQTGLLANCVARRVSTLASAEQRKLIWFLQCLSHQAGGLDKAAEEMLALWPERFATRRMHELGFEHGRNYSAEEVRVARASIRDGVLWSAFPLRGEAPDGNEWRQALAGFGIGTEERERLRRNEAANLRAARSHPRTYPASAFTDVCADAAREGFGKFLFERLCLDPALALDAETLWYLPGLVETLRDYHAVYVQRAAAAAPVTMEIGAQVCETLEYALAERCLVVIDGLARTGKTFAVKAWCQAHPGEARYVQVPSSNDDMGFFRAICAALGLSDSRAYKALDLREKIEATLSGGDLLLVMDEGHYLFSQRNMRKSVPHRINWLLTQLVNMGVPVAIVTTPQFTKNQETVVRNGGWSSEQLIGRISHYQRLPDEISEKDLAAVARFWLPAGDEESIRILTTYARSSEKYLQAIESLVRRARFLAGKAGRLHPTFLDVAEALNQGVVPSDKSLAAALASARSPRTVGRPRATPAEPPRAPREATARPTPSQVLPPRETRPPAPSPRARADAGALFAT